MIDEDKTTPEAEDLLPEDAPVEDTRDAEIAELKDRVLRAAAETENVRRRLEDPGPLRSGPLRQDRG